MAQTTLEKQPQQTELVQTDWNIYKVQQADRTIATIIKDAKPFTTQPWAVLIDGVEMFRDNTLAKCESWVRWHNNQGTLPVSQQVGGLVRRIAEVAPPVELPSGEWWEILGVHRFCTYEEAKKAWKEKVSEYHPDVNPNGGEIIKIVNDAWDQAELKFLPELTVRRMAAEYQEKQAEEQKNKTQSPTQTKEEARAKLKAEIAKKKEELATARLKRREEQARKAEKMAKRRAELARKAEEIAKRKFEAAKKSKEISERKAEAARLAQEVAKMKAEVLANTGKISERKAKAAIKAEQVAKHKAEMAIKANVIANRKFEDAIKSEQRAVRKAELAQNAKEIAKQKAAAIL